MKQFYLIALLFISAFSYAQLVPPTNLQAYYSGIDFDNTGLTLKDALSTKTISKHTNFLSYSNVWNALKITDEDPDNNSNVLLIYGFNDNGNVTEHRSRNKNDNGGNVGDWNREHTYPRSLGTPNLGTSGPGSDAQMLRPSDVQRNGQRGSDKFADGNGNSQTIGSNWYPGDEWKGDCARMMMYMYIRYGSQCLPSNVGVGSNASTPDDMIDLFLKWNAEDPVSNIEITRNDYHENTSNTYAQGNRNPFIDNPYLANVIWGTPTGSNDAENRWEPLSIEEFTQNAIKIFPNPVKNILHIDLSNPIATQIEIFDILGKKVFNQNINNSDSINIEVLHSGIYIIKITQNNASVSKKLIKQ